MKIRRHVASAFLGLALVASGPVACAQDAAPLCDYSRVGMGTGPYAKIPVKYLSDKCIRVRSQSQNLIRAPLDALDFVTACTVEIATKGEGDSESDCTPLPTYVIGDRFNIREWNGEFTLTMRRANTQRLDIVLHKAPALMDVDREAIKGVPWLWGVDGKLKYFVYLDQKPVGSDIYKYYRLEVFNTDDPKWARCSTHLPDKAPDQVDCNLPLGPLGFGQESDTGGGGEPPPRPRP